MKNLSKISYLILFLVSIQSFAHSTKQSYVKPYVKSKNDTRKSWEIYSSYEVKNISNKNLNAIRELFTVTGQTGPNSYEVLIRKIDKRNLIKFAPKATLITEDVDRWQYDESIDLSAYRSYDQVIEESKELASKYDFVKFVEFGRAKDNLVQFYLEISDADDVASDGKKEQIVEIDAATHGDELITVETLMNNMIEFVDKYAAGDARAKSIVDNLKVIIVPVVSPYSFKRKSRNVGRYDPNRSFPGYDTRGTPNNLKDRVQAIKNIINNVYDKLKPVATNNWHAATNPGMVMHAWGYKSRRECNPDGKHNTYFTNLRNSMNSGVVGKKYSAGPIACIIYSAGNSSADYLYMKPDQRAGKDLDYRSFAMAIEVGSGGDGSNGGKIPSASRIPHYTKQVKGIFWNYLEYFVKNRFDDQLNKVN